MDSSLNYFSVDELVHVLPGGTVGGLLFAEFGEYLDLPLVLRDRDYLLELELPLNGLVLQTH